MTKEYGWKEQLDVGARGEEVVLQWMKKNLDGIFLDARQVSKFQQKDIDFLLYTGDDPDEVPIWIEVKTDAYDNDNLFLELYAGNGKSPGALFKSRADVWYYYKARKGYIIEFSPAEVAAAVARLDFHPQLVAVSNRNEQGKKRIAAWGVRVTLDWMQEFPSTKVHYVQEVRDEAGASE